MIIAKPVSLTILCQLVLFASAWVNHLHRNHHAVTAALPWSRQQQQQKKQQAPSTRLCAAASNNSEAESSSSSSLGGLMTTLTENLDRWIITGSDATRNRAYSCLQEIENQAADPEDYQRAVRLARRAGLPAETTAATVNNNQQRNAQPGSNDEARRKSEAEARKQWEASRAGAGGGSAGSEQGGGRSALSRRSTNNGKPDVFMGKVIETTGGQAGGGLPKPKQVADDKLAFEKQLRQDTTTTSTTTSDHSPTTRAAAEPVDRTKQAWQKKDANAKVAELVARAGALSSFEGEKLGIGGLDDVLSEVKRRIWTPLAAPPQLLRELGIHPVRGLLLYGRPGCGKTLLARKLGQMLSPLRPITVVSGPEVLDKFVGSSEKNLRAIFDSPPDIYDFFRIGESDGGDSLAQAALHVVVMDEFDAIARTRGGSGGKGDQGDAGVARDSVVNQLLAKMDGVEALTVPTLVIGLTNKRSLVDDALLRPGRFEVQIEVPPPRTAEQRASILKVHTQSMYDAGRLLVRDAPSGSPAALRCQNGVDEAIPASYHELLQQLAEDTAGFSGASLAGVARAAASHALERAVEDFTSHVMDEDERISSSSSLLTDCLVTYEDLTSAVEDVRNSQGRTDWEEDEEINTADEATNADKQPVNADTAETQAAE